jgi:hypothetical protein
MRNDDKAASTMTDEEYEAELQARTPEEWAAIREKGLADGNDMVTLQHLMWRRDVKDWGHVVKLATNQDSTLADHDYALRQASEIAGRLRNARDNPEQCERERWQNLMLCAAIAMDDTRSKDSTKSDFHLVSVFLLKIFFVLERRLD